ncbi:SRP54-type protein [Polychytrium aggregatum]|uniref:SRP54-type protein n=1 Tax=Polychytrium aggregatum TaxID=110093 RepID=UPI0022FECBD2|nr:SRP54-type protein [Polychytrium aggregatum]KAI9208885.1 SRP54-type protein [Polychytrium aggregatum]
MLDSVAIFTAGGIVLWSRQYCNFKGGIDPIGALVKEVLVEERGHTSSFIKDSYELKWLLRNDLNLIFVVVYQKILHLSYIDDLLDKTAQVFCERYLNEIKDASAIHEYPFEDEFETILGHVEAQESERKKSRGPRKFEKADASKSSRTKGKSDEVTDPDGEKDGESAKDDDALAQKLAQLQGARGIGKRQVGSPKVGGGKKPGKSTPEPKPAAGKSTKENRVWNDGKGPVKYDDSLDYSDAKGAEDASSLAASLVDQNSMGTTDENGMYNVPEMEAGAQPEDEDILEANGYVTVEVPAAAKPAAKSGLFSFFKSLTGGKVLSATDLDPIMAKMKDHLVSKNVAADIAQVLCDSVSKGMVGKKVGTFTTISSLVRENMEIALKRILTPRTSTDVLRDVFAAKSEGRPYSFVFIGVNGVGKSTNLSKVCFWLLQNKLKVLIAACDTFRSGAVEQLRVHARNLQALEQNGTVQLFERGYGKDSATIAKDAIGYAKTNGFDVVLIDTAGRMQDNEPLMRALAKLVSVNSPDKILFVGEALVGNEAVDQLSKFNQALKDFSGQQHARQIDGIILTKFDTIDDKVGAALSMTYVTGQPILFVGTGQTYTDLRKMNVKSIVNSLLAN